MKRSYQPSLCRIQYQNGNYNSLRIFGYIDIKNGEKGKVQSKMAASKGKSNVLESHFAKSSKCKFDEQNIVFTHYLLGDFLKNTWP